MLSRKLVVAGYFCVLLLNILCFLPISVSPEPEITGDISFVPNVIPQLTLTPRTGRNNESFRFEWLKNTFDLEIFFNATYERRGVNETGLFSLLDFEEDFNVTVNYLTNRTVSNVQFGWVIDNVENISDFVDSAWFKIEDTKPFDYDDIELEEIEVLELEGEPYNITRFHLPDNLVLSFEDLHHKGFVIGWQNKTSTCVKGFSGKSSWNLDPITFSSNIVTVIGGTAGSPLDYEDLWDADKAGTFTLVERADIESTDGAQVLVNESLRATDYAELGGNNYDLTMTVGINRTYTGGAYFAIRVIGFARAGTYQSELVTFSGVSPGYHTESLANKYAVINATQVEVLGASSDLNYTLFQGQWGVVWETSSTQYNFDARIVFGNGTVAGTTYFNDTNKQITFTDFPTASYTLLQELKVYSHVTIGTLQDATGKTSTDGCQFISLEGSAYLPYIFFEYAYANSELLVFSSTFQAPNGVHALYLRRGAKVYNSQFDNVQLLISDSVGPQDYYNIQMSGTGNAMSYCIAGATNTYDRITVTESNRLLYTHGSYISNFSNVYARENNEIAYFPSSPLWTGQLNIIDSDIDVWAFTFVAGVTGKVYRIYHFNLNVTNDAGTPIEDANVTVSHYGENAGQDFTVLTNSNGSFATQTLTMGFYNYTGGDNIYDYNPYNLRIEASTYPTIDFNFTLKEPIDWQMLVHGKTTGWTVALWAIAGLILLPIGTICFLVWKKK